MKMKPVYLVFLAILIVLTSVSIASAHPLEVTFEQNPFPSHAGEQVTLTFHVTNNGDSNLSDILFKLDVNDPLSLRSASEKTISLDAGQEKTINYAAYVDESASEGKEQVTLSYEIDGNTYDEDFDVQIASNQIYLQVESVNSFPSQVAPGNNVSLNINLRNTANSEIKDIILNLDLTALPFAPESVTEGRMASINERGSSQISFSLIALPTAEIGVYKIPLLITYYDSYGNKYERQDLVSVEVFEKPEIEVNVEKDSLINEMPSTVSIKVLNKGLGKVNFVSLKILPSQDYEINGIDSEYLGNIESDDYSSIEFNLTPKKQNFNLELVLEYRDANNQKYSETKIVNIKAYSAQEAQRLGLLPSFPWLVVIVVLVIIALIIFFVVRRNKKKKKLMS